MAAHSDVPHQKSSLRKEIERRRTFAIISHPDAGKTTLTEKLLLFGGAINLAGAVKAEGKPPCHQRLDEHRAGAGHFRHQLGDEVRVPRLRDQPAGHAGPRGFLGGHLPGADRRGQRDHGDRQREGRGDPDPEAHGGVPDAEHPHHHLHQQGWTGRVWPPWTSWATSRRSSRWSAPVVAHRHGKALPGHLQPLPEGAEPLLREATGWRTCGPSGM